MPVNVSSIIGALLTNGMPLKEIVSGSHKIEHTSKNKADFRLVIDLLAGMGLRIILDGDRFKTAPLLSSVHSNVPPSLSDDAQRILPYAARRQVGTYQLLPAYAENHIPVKMEAWLKVSSSTWFPVILYRAMSSVQNLSEASQWCSRFYCTVNIPVIDLNEDTHSLRLLRVSAPIAAGIYAQQSVAFTLTDVNNGKKRAEHSSNRYTASAVEPLESTLLTELAGKFSEAFPLLQASFQNKNELNVGEAIRLRKLIHYASDLSLMDVQANLLKAGGRT